MVLRTPSGRRRTAGSVSGTAFAATATRMSPSTASTTKTPRHEVNRSTSPPIVGASTGATPSTSISRENRVAAARPTNRSRTIAIVTTDAAAAPTPCITRRPPSTATFGATRHRSDARTCTPTPTSSGRRRPKVSDSGPTRSWPRARPTRVPVSVSCTAAEVVCEVVHDRRQRRQVHVDGQRAERDQRTEDEDQPQPPPPGRCDDRGRGRSQSRRHEVPFRYYVHQASTSLCNA